jgi:trimethylamine--corrinoid protein Co-methyltransferase
MSATRDSLRLLEPGGLQQLHDASLAILSLPGMRIDNSRLRDTLRRAGADVDEVHHGVRFPPRLVEATIEGLQASIRSGTPQIVLNGVVASLTQPAMAVKFGGACIEVYDFDKGSTRQPRRQDLVDLVRLGEALPEVGTVGNPVTYLTEDDGTPIDPRLQRVRTAALIARYTRKAGPTEVWSGKELKYLIELGQIVRGSREAYLANPCFITAKETIAPLILDQDAGEVLLLLAENGLPCTLIPMPVSGGSSPLSMASNIALGNAEILGVFCALRAACPTANCVGGIISGVLDMRSAAAVFGAPESALQDLGLAELHERLYGFDFGVGGYVDAKLPGEQIAIEVMGRFALLARSGRFNVPVGLLNGGKRFSAEQALVDIEIERWILESLKPIQVSPETLRVDQIRSVGIGGNSLMEDHTREFMRKNVWYPLLMDRTLAAGGGSARTSDMLSNARERVRGILSRTDLFEADQDHCRAIDEVVRAAERDLAG